jgi:hypothetical protein
MAQADVPVQGTSRIHLGWMGIGVLAVVVARGRSLRST